MNAFFSFDLFIFYIHEYIQATAMNYEIIHADTRACTL